MDKTGKIKVWKVKKSVNDIRLVSVEFSISSLVSEHANFYRNLTVLINILFVPSNIDLIIFLLVSISKEFFAIFIKKA